MGKTKRPARDIGGLKLEEPGLGPLVRPAFRLLQFIGWAADIVGGTAVKMGLLGVLVTGIYLLVIWNVPEKSRLGGIGALCICAMVVWAGLFLMSGGRRVENFVAGDAVPVIPGLQRVLKAGLPLGIGIGVLFGAVLLEDGGERSWSYVLGAAAVLLFGFGGPIAALIALTKYRGVYRRWEDALGVGPGGEPSDTLT